MRDVIPLSQKSYVLNIWQFLATCNRKNHEQKKASVALLIGTQGENKKQKKCFNWAPIIVACLQLLWLNLTRSAKHASNAGAGSNQPAFCIFGPMGQPPWHFWSHGSTTLAWEFVEIHPFPACRAVRRSSQWGRFCCLTAFCFVILALIQILCYVENSTHTSPLCAGDILIQRRTKGSTVRWQRSVSRNVGKVKAVNASGKEGMRWIAIKTSFSVKLLLQLNTCALPGQVYKLHANKFIQIVKIMNIWSEITAMSVTAEPTVRLCSGAVLALMNLLPAEYIQSTWQD